MPCTLALKQPVPALSKCPNSSCLYAGPLLRFGFSRAIACLDGKRRQRFRCPVCGRVCSENVHKIHYRLRHKDPALNSKILQFTLHGLSNRKTSRLLELSEHSVRIRLTRLSQRALEFHHNSIANLKIAEPVCFDGLENFAASQYDPNNIQQAVGRNSLFIYDFNFASMNRKGRMSPWQKRRLQHIVAAQGRYNPRAIRLATKDILSRIYARKSEERLLLLSDEHFQYRRVLSEDLKAAKIDHLTVSSKACRNFQNILFSVNHADLLIRQSVAAFSRETISFSKTAGRMCQRYALFMVYKNYMSPQFTKKHVHRAEVEKTSPAQRLGLCDRVLGFRDIYSLRSYRHNTKRWNEDWKSFWNAKVPDKYMRSKSFA